MVKSSAQHSRSGPSSSATKLKRSNSLLRKSKYGNTSNRYNDEEDDDHLDEYLRNKVVAFEDFGDAQDVLKLFEFKDKIRSTQQLRRNVVIKIEASTVSMMDVLIRRDQWHDSVTHPYKTGCDLVGRVINVGDRVEGNIQEGDLVCAMGLSIGGNAKYAIVPSSRIFSCPEDIDPSVIACLVRNYMAAYQCLHRVGGLKVKPDHKILILGGAGAFGQACIQLAIAAGADEIYATGKSDQSQITIESLGAEALGRNPSEWLPTVKGRMDIVIDSVCSDHYRSSHRALNKRGKLVCVGTTSALSGKSLSAKFDIQKATKLMSQTTVFDIFSYFESRRDIYKKDILRLFHLCRNHEISPRVAYCIPLNEVANAHDDIEAGGIDGSIVCLPFGPTPGAKELNQNNEDEALVTEYADGTKIRVNITGGALETRVGKVLKDGSFKVLKVKRAPDRTSTRKIDTRDYYDDSDVDRRGGRVKSSPGARDNRNDSDVDRRGGRSSKTSRKNPSNHRTHTTRKYNQYEEQSVESYTTEYTERTGVSTPPSKCEDETVTEKSFVTETDESAGMDISHDDADSIANSSFTPLPERYSSRGAPSSSSVRKRNSRGDNGRISGYDRREASRDRHYDERDDNGSPTKPARRGTSLRPNNRYGNESSTQRGKGSAPATSSRRETRESRGHGNSRATPTAPRGRSQSRGRGERERSQSRGRGGVETRGRSQSRGRGERERSQSRGRGGVETRGRSQSRGRGERGRSQSSGRGGQQRTRSQSRGRGGPQPPRARSRSKGPQERNARPQSRGPQQRARSKSRGRAQPSDRSPSVGSVVSEDSAEEKKKTLFSRFKIGRKRSVSRARKDIVQQSALKDKSRVNSTTKSGRERSSSRKPKKQEMSAREKQKERELRRREMMYVEQDPEESSLFPEIEAVRSIVPMKGADELADEQSEVSWDGTAREERHSKRDRESRGPSRKPPPIGNRPSRSSNQNRPSRSSRPPAQSQSGGIRRTRSQSRTRAQQPSQRSGASRSRQTRSSSRVRIQE